MNALEKIAYAEERVAGLQDSLEIAESVLESAEQIAVTGARAGRCARRSLRILLVLGVAVVGVVVAKKLMDRRAAGLEPEVIDTGATIDGNIDETDTEEGPAAS